MLFLNHNWSFLSVELYKRNKVGLSAVRSVCSTSRIRELATHHRTNEPAVWLAGRVGGCTVRFMGGQKLKSEVLYNLKSRFFKCIMMCFVSSNLTFCENRSFMILNTVRKHQLKRFICLIQYCSISQSLSADKGFKLELNR